MPDHDEAARRDDTTQVSGDAAVSADQAVSAGRAAPAGQAHDAAAEPQAADAYHDADAGAGADALAAAPEHGASSYARDKADLLNRLHRIEGQVRGLARMVEQDRYCVDILVQIAAVRSALDRVGLTLLRSHTTHCVANAIRTGRGEPQIDELMDVFARFIK